VIDRMPGRVPRVLDLAWEEANGLGHRYLGPEHVVLGVLRDDASGVAQLLRTRGLRLEGGSGIAAPHGGTRGAGPPAARRRQ